MAVYLNERGIDPGPHVGAAAHPERMKEKAPEKRSKKSELISVVVLSLCDGCAEDLELPRGGVVFEPGRDAGCIEIMKARGLIVDNE